MKSNDAPKTVSAYIAQAPKRSLPHLRTLHSYIKKLIPGGGVYVMRYGIPTVQLNGKNVLHYGGYTTHIGFYPGSKAIAHFRTELRRYHTRKGTVQFSLDEKLPLTLIKNMVRFCVREHNARMPQ